MDTLSRDVSLTILILVIIICLEPSNSRSVTVQKIIKPPFQHSVNGDSRNYSSSSMCQKSKKDYSCNNKYLSKSPIRSCCRSTGDLSRTNNYYTVVNIEFKTNVQKVKRSILINTLQNIQFYVDLCSMHLFLN